MGVVAPADLRDRRALRSTIQPILAYLIMTTAYSILLSWVFLHTRGSVLIATWFHGAINVSQGYFLAGTDPDGPVLVAGPRVGRHGAGVGRGPRPWTVPSTARRRSDTRFQAV